jgi:hypothetical protein
MSNKIKPKPTPAPKLANDKQPHLAHLRRVQAGLAMAGLSAEPVIIDLIVKVNEAVKNTAVTLDAIEAIRDENLEWHTK